MRFFKYGDRVRFNFNSPANMAVVVKINAAGNWQDTVASVLSKLEGIDRFELDAEQGIVKILGNLDPDMLMRVLNKSTKNAEMIKAYLTKDGVALEDIFAVGPACLCPKCAPETHCCSNRDSYCIHNQLAAGGYGGYGGGYGYGYGGYGGGGYVVAPSSPHFCHAGGDVGRENNSNNYPLMLTSPRPPPQPVPAIEYYYPSAGRWQLPPPPPLQIDPYYYENEPAGCSIM